MRICVVSHRNATRDPRVRALAASLCAAGHHVTVVGVGLPEPIDGVETVAVPVRLPRGLGAVGRLLRRSQPSWLAARLQERELRRTVAAVRPDLVYPHLEGDASLAEATAAPIVGRPEWRLPISIVDRDLVSIAPHLDTPWVGSSTATRPTPGPPPPGRHRGTEIVIAYRVTPTNPGRYLEAAMRRSGAEVTVLDGVLDWNEVPPTAAAVVIVESPYPALDVVGANPGVPVMFWVHHGEHHLPTNLRLAGRYGAHAILLAHSWHLAHRFPVPVHRFPFGVAPELMDGEPPAWPSRTHDVAMVGAGFGSLGARYEKRRRIMESLAETFPGTSSFTYGVSPEEMVAGYADSRVVVNDGGAKHLPITMRVFEAIGAGALLLTEDLPGTEVLFERGRHYVPMQDDVAAQVQTLLTDPSSPLIAGAARQHAMDVHTYDHRIDSLLLIAASTATTAPARAPSEPASALGALVDGDVDAQDLALFGVTTPIGLDDRIQRDGEARRLNPSSVDAVVIGPGGATDLRAAVAAARAYLYAEGPHVPAVAELTAELHPGAAVEVTGDGLLRADLGGTGYGRRERVTAPG